MQFAGVTITAETIERTRGYFADLCTECIHDAQSGKTFVNDLARYVAWQEQLSADYLAGKGDHTLTFLQRAHWLQTGECVPLFSR